MAPMPDESLVLNAVSIRGNEAYLSGEAKENACGVGRRLQTGSEELMRPKRAKKGYSS